MTANKIFCGDALTVLKTLPDESVNCVITSPPYWQLRDYKFEGQWGLEPTFQEYLEHLRSMMDELYRILKDDGTVFINLGDTYCSNGGQGLTGGNLGNKEALLAKNSRVKMEGVNKCLLLIPHRFAIGCIDRGWIVRNDIIWAKRNGMPESVNDRFSKKHEYMFFMVKQQKYYFDLDAIKDKCKPLNRWGGDTLKAKGKGNWDKGTGQELYRDRKLQPNKDKNPGSVSDFWDIPTKPSSSKHYATYNDTLLVKPILAGCPPKGVILDPFMGTATTGLAALRAGRGFIGIEGKEEYYNIANTHISNFMAQKVIDL